ncbi:MAG TPA: class I SAM-dependent methyltransferase [Aggregatilineaceae bacterium]|nr:class I SAM-dependent methyltransferase [Aggregatilineaceae bacterium]
MRRWLRRWLNAKIDPPTLPSAEAFALWAESYPPYAHNTFMTIEQDAMAALIPPLQGQTVLDLACGSGRYAQIALKAGAGAVIGADSSPAMLRQAAGFPHLQADMTSLPFAPSAFDMILCGLATGHLPPEAMRTAVAEMARVLRPGGRLVFSDFHPFVYLSGRRRTFTTANGQTYAVQHYPHLIADYFEATRAADLRIAAIREAKAALDGRDVPAVLVIACTKG